MLNESQAVEIAKRWLQQETGINLPVECAFQRPSDEEDRLFDPRVRWTVLFKCDVPEGFSPEEIIVHVDASTGEVNAPMTI